LSAAQAQIKSLTGQIGVLSAAFNTLDKSAMKAQATLSAGFMSSVGQIGGFTTQMVKTNSAVETFGQSIAKNRLTMRQYFREAFLGYRKQSSMLNKLAQQQVMMQQSTLLPLGGGRSAVITPTSLDKIANKSALAAQKMSIFNELVQGGSTRLLNFGKNTQWTGRQLMVGFTLPLVLFTALVSKQFREIDKELTRFEKVYGADLGESVEGSTKKMREQVKQLAFDISASYGIAAKETAALAADIAQTGKEGQALIDSIKQTTRLAVLGEVERQEAMRATLSIQNAFKLNTLELAESIDFLNAVENETSTNLQDLAGAIPRVGPVIQALNGDIKDMSLLLVAMREGGVAAGEAANALKSGLGRLINPTKAARDVAASFGISLENIIQNSRGELIPMIFALQDSLQGLDDFAKAQVIEKLFGKYQFARMSALFENLRRQGSQTLSVMELASSSSTELASIANQELATLQQSSAMRFQRAVETMKNSLIPLGEVLTETIIPILSGLGNAISSFMNFFSDLPGPIKSFTKFALIVTSLAGPVVMLVGLFANLAANGIKAAAGLTRLGARLVGIKINKFELLTKDVLAANMGVDALTTSFVEQDVALKRLSQTLGIYGARLQQTLLQNPAFIAGRPGTPIRRQSGSDRPEFIPGQGRGDKIPAMLEPGEFVVNRNATEKFAPILMAMNRGTVQGLQEGTPVPGTRRAHITSPLLISAGDLLARDAALRAAGQKGMAPHVRETLLAKDAMGNLAIKSTDLIRVFNNLVLALTNDTNNMLKAGTMRAASLAEEMSSSKAWTYVMNMTGLEMKELNPVVNLITKRLMDLGNAVIDDPAMYEIVERSLAELSMKSNDAAKTLQKLSMQYGTYADPRRGADQGHRGRLGIGFGPSYTDKAYIPGGRLQNAPFVNFGTPASATTPAAYQAVNKTVEQELGLAQRRVAAAKALEGYQAHRQKLQDKLVISERQESLLRDDITKITRDTKIPLSEKLRLQNEINRDIKEEIALRQRINGVLVRLEGNIQAAANRMAVLGGPSALGRGPGGAPGYLSGGGSPYALPSVLMASMGSGARGVSPIDRALERAKARGGITPPPPSERIKKLIGPGVDKNGMQMGGPRGQGLMNAAFMSTMVISSFSMMGGASNDLAIKLGLLSTAVMTATIAMQMFAGKNIAGNFLGLGSLGKKISSAGAAKQAASFTSMGPVKPLPGLSGVYGTGGPSSKFTPTPAKGGPGAGLLRTGSMVSMLGGPLGMAAAAAAVAGVTGFMLYKKAAEEARERAVAAFADPTKTAEYFGVSISDVTEKLKAISSAVPGLEEVDENLRVAVREDYAKLIEKIRYGGAEAGGKELGIVFNKMIASGLSAEQAKEAVKAIAIESGTVGGQAYAQAMRQGMLADKSGADIARSMAATFDPEQQADSIRAAQATLDKAEDSVGRLGRIGTVISQASDNIIGEVASYGIAIGAVFAGVDFDREGFRETITLAAETERQIHQMQVGIEEMSDVSADSMVKITEVMFENFKKAPKETIDAMRQIQEAGRASSAVAFDTQPIKDFISEIDPIGGIILNSIIGDNEEIAGKVMEGIAAGMSITEIIDALEKGGIPELDIQVNLNIKEQNVQLELDRLKSDLQEDLVLDLDMQIEDEEEQLDGVNKQLERMDKFRARHEGVLKKEMNRLNRASQTAIDGMESEIDLIRERADTRREDFDERMDELNKEKDQIDESADAYIDSLRKRERADSFYSNQRKTAFGALQKLAAGDVFGFLQDREQMSSEAQTFAYDNAIESIEDKRDREIDAIDEVMDKEKEKQEDYEKKVETRIELIEDQIDAEKDLMDQRQKDFDRQMRFFDRRQKRRGEDLESEKRGLEVSLTQLRATRDMAEKNVLIDQERLSKALGEEKAKPYMVEQKEILKTEMMKKYLEMKSEFPDESPLEWRQRAYTDLMDLFNAVYGITNRPGQSSGTSMMNFQLEDIGFTPNFNAGGPVKGPGTPTSDSIPAMLSNGEYVVRASSVSKYGKSMMDTINAGNFATGGYVSADRAETAASGNRYLGGVKPKPTYSGGTPTSSTGYSTANTQAQSNIYSPKKYKNKGTPMRPVSWTPIPGAEVLERDRRLSGQQWEASWGHTLMADMWNSTKIGVASIVDGFLKGWMPTFLRTPENMRTPVGSFIGGSGYADAGFLEQALDASALLPLPIPVGKAASFVGRSVAGKAWTGIKEGARRSLGTPIRPVKPSVARATFGRGNATTMLNSIVGKDLKEYLLKNPEALPEGITLNSLSDDPELAQVLSTFISKYALTPEDKLRYSSLASVAKGPMPITVMDRETIMKVAPILRDALTKSTPSNLPGGSSLDDIIASHPAFKELSATEKNALFEYRKFIGDSVRGIDHHASARFGSLNSPFFTRGQLISNEGNFVQVLDHLAHELGHSRDFVYGSSKYWKYLHPNQNALRKGPLGLYLGDMQFASQVGKTEALAESNRLRSMYGLLKDSAAMSPEELAMYQNQGLGVHPYAAGVNPGMYSNSPIFKVMYALALKNAMRGKNPNFLMQEGFSLRNSGILPDAITSAFPWMMGKGKSSKIPGVGSSPGSVFSPAGREALDIINNARHGSTSTKDLSDPTNLLHPRDVASVIGTRMGQGLYTTTDFNAVSQTVRDHLLQNPSTFYRIKLTEDAAGQVASGRGYMPFLEEFVPAWLKYGRESGRIQTPIDKWLNTPASTALAFRNFKGGSWDDPFIQDLIEKGYIGASDDRWLSQVNWLPGVPGSGWNLSPVDYTDIPWRGVAENFSQSRSSAMWDLAHARKYAKGGLVGDIQKFAGGGIVQTRAMSGPNGWPHLTSYSSNLLATGKVPGSGVSLTARREVLPLFLAIASEYNKRIRKVDPSQTAAFDLRLDRPHDERARSNHPSGTAMDINWSNEGAISSSEALYNWWAGRPSSSAPWKSISNIPAADAKNIKNRFNRFGEIIEWYGSSKLGGDWLGSGPDWMHWQISQTTKPGPDKVKEITRRLGIDDNGVFDGGSGDPGEENTGGGKPGKTRPRKGANGTGGPSIIPGGDSTGAGSSGFGKVVARYLSRLILPGKGGGEKPDKPDTPDTPDTPTDSPSKRYIRGAQLVKLLHQTGFKGSDLRTAFGVVMGESGGDRKAVNNNGSNKDWGLFQMNDYWNRNIMVDGKKADFSPDKIFDAGYNSRFALATTKDPGVIEYWKDPWKDWNAYNNNTRWYQNGLKQFDQNPQWRKALGLANGGSVFGPGGPRSDSIPAMLSNGEYVVNSDSVKKYGRGFLDKINSEQLGNTSMVPAGFANGGMVTPSYNVPVNNNVSTSQLMNNANNMAVQGSSSTANSNNIKIVINGTGTNAKSVANQVVRMINNATDRRDHARSAG